MAGREGRKMEGTNKLTSIPSFLLKYLLPNWGCNGGKGINFGLKFTIICSLFIHENLFKQHECNLITRPLVLIL